MCIYIFIQWNEAFNFGPNVAKQKTKGRVVILRHVFRGTGDCAPATCFKIPNNIEKISLGIVK